MVGKATSSICCGLDRGEERRAAGSGVVERRVRNEYELGIVREDNRWLLNQIRCCIAINDLPGGTHPGTQNGAMRPFLMMFVVSFMSEALSRGQATEDEDTERQQDGECSLCLDTVHACGSLKGNK